MNLKTTFILLIVLAGVGIVLWSGSALFGWLGYLPPAPDTGGAGTLAILANEVTPETLTRVEIRSGDRHVLLERGPDKEWSMPGRWPTRGAEVAHLLGTLGELRTRFAPIPASDEQALAIYNLKNPALTVVLHANGVEHRLAFG